MNAKEKRLAAQFLAEAADQYGNHSCNDWDFPHDWTAEERTEFCRACHAWNATPQDFDPKHLHLPDFAVMSYLASALYCEAEEK